MGIVPEEQLKAPSPPKKTVPDGPPPITVTLPKGIVVIDQERQKFLCDYCSNKPLNSMFQIEQVEYSNHLNTEWCPEYQTVWVSGIQMVKS